MFAKLSGIIDDITQTHVLMDVGGVGSLVAVSARTRGRLERGTSARLLIETQVREDAINLYGFIDAEEQAWFRLLTSVQGVGPRVGLALLSACSSSDLTLALASQDKTILTRADGVGPKLATRIVTELKDKVPDYMAVSVTPLGTGPVKGTATASSRDHAVRPGAERSAAAGMDADAISALVNLGYGRAEAFSAVARVRASHTPDTVGDMIRQALNELTGRTAA